jgi:hypothetical protein
VSHDEITTKLEIPKRRATDNIVRVNFAQGNSNRPDNHKGNRKANQNSSSASAAIPQGRRSSLFPRLKEFDFTAPWVIRLVAVIAVLILSMLIL